MVYAILHHPENFAQRSGLFPLVQALGATPVFYDMTLERLQKRSWTAGQWLRDWGVRHYGSTWNALVPWRDERRLAREADAGAGDVVHFLWGEFAAPREPRRFNGRGAKIVGTFHCSARRQPQVLGNFRCLQNFDRISVMSKSQIPFFVGRGFPAERIDVTLHGVDSEFFCPPAKEIVRGNDALNLLLVGSTERDHEFAAAVMGELRNDSVRLGVLTSKVNHAAYAGLGNVTILPFFNDEELRDAYRNADLVFMPLLDCTANNAVLEAMSCGTPVMTNRVGGIPEYVDAESNFVFDGKDAKNWADRIRAINSSRAELAQRRIAVRAWAEKFSWRLVAPMFHDFNSRALAS